VRVHTLWYAVCGTTLCSDRSQVNSFLSELSQNGWHRAQPLRHVSGLPLACLIFGEAVEKSRRCSTNKDSAVLSRLKTLHQSLDRAVAGHRAPPRVRAGRLRCLLANVECRTMAVHPFSARFHPSLARPVRCPRPLGLPNELPAMEFSAAILSAAVPERRSRRTPMRTTSQPRAPVLPADDGHLTNETAGLAGRMSVFRTAQEAHPEVSVAGSPPSN
jgi:hypothetical protein